MAILFLQIPFLVPTAGQRRASPLLTTTGPVARAPGRRGAPAGIPSWQASLLPPHPPPAAAHLNTRAPGPPQASRPCSSWRASSGLPLTRHRLLPIEHQGAGAAVASGHAPSWRAAPGAPHPPPAAAPRAPGRRGRRGSPASSGVPCHTGHRYLPIWYRAAAGPSAGSPSWRASSGAPLIRHRLLPIEHQGRRGRRRPPGHAAQLAGELRGSPSPRHRLPPIEHQGRRGRRGSPASSGVPAIPVTGTCRSWYWPGRRGALGRDPQLAGTRLPGPPSSWRASGHPPPAAAHRAPGRRGRRGSPASSGVPAIPVTGTCRSGTGPPGASAGIPSWQASSGAPPSSATGCRPSSTGAPGPPQAYRPWCRAAAGAPGRDPQLAGRPSSGAAPSAPGPPAAAHRAPGLPPIEPGPQPPGLRVCE